MTVLVRWRSSVSLVGSILQWLVVPLSLPLAIAVYERTDVLPFVATILVTAVLGFSLERLQTDRETGVREAFLMVALVWLGIALVGALPFVLAGNGVLAHPVNALFESTSGVTTTGATVIQEFDAHSRAVLMWRQVIQWIGGLGVLVLAIAVLSQLSVAGAQLMETETQTRDVRKLTPSISSTARLLGGLYLGLTALIVGVLLALSVVGLAPEMTPFDAVAHAFTTISTSGFSPRADSLAAFSPSVQWVTALFMAVGGTNFVLLYYVFRGNVHRLAASEEFRFYVAVLLALGTAVSVLVLVDPGLALTGLDAVRHAFFQVISLVTGTGYASANFDTWSASTKQLLFVAMFFGGMAGSTTCSIKMLRWLVVLKSFNRDLFTAANPDAVRPVRLSGNPIDEDTIRDVYAYTLVSLVIFIVATVVVVIDAARVDLVVTEFEAMGAAAATFFNVGPGFGVAGPFASYEVFPTSTKLLMILLMWVGRIEIIPVLVLLKPSFWRR